MNLRSGWGAIQDVAERMAERHGSIRDRMITWDPEMEGGDSKIVRLIDEAPIVVGIHHRVECKDGRHRHFTCATELDDKRTCYICDTMTTETFDGRIIPLAPKTVGVGMAALREEVRVDGETRIADKLVDVKLPIEGREDITAKLEALGVTVAGDKALGIPDVGILRQSIGNFWSSFNSYYGRYGSANDRDYRVAREGVGLETTYTVLPCEQDESMTTAQEVEARYAAAQLLRTPVIEYLERMGSEEYYDRHLIPGEGDTPEAKAFSQGRTLADLRTRAESSGKAAPAAEADKDPDEAKYTSLTARLQNLNS